MKIKIAYLYPELLNIYGDKGNVIAFVNRCLWRNIETEIHEIHTGDKINPDLYDFYFIGGGQDEQQIAVAAELQSQKEALTQARDNMAVFLAICGGYQLLGHYYKPHAGDELRGISLLDAYTVAGNTRFIGNVTVELNIILRGHSPFASRQFHPFPQNVILRGHSPFVSRQFHPFPQNVILSEAKNLSNADKILKQVQDDSFPLDRLPRRGFTPPRNDNANIIVGFENHSGLTYLQGDTKPIGLVTTGNGNNEKDKTEGAFYKNVFGTYLHGSFLPKNPHFTDYLISLALERNYGHVELEPLNDEIEWGAHKKAIGRKY